MFIMSWLTILFSCLLFWHVQGHVRLTFPPARTYALDFLDNGRTRGPCGFPTYPGAPRTTLIEGTHIRVTWHLAYAHRGGAELQIIRENPFQVITSLTNNIFKFQNDSTRQHADVILPVNFTCSDCSLRLLRQASEWGGAYRFWSCADVTILPHPNTTSVTCSVAAPTPQVPTPIVPNGEPEPPAGEPEPGYEHQETAEPEPSSEKNQPGSEPEPISEHQPSTEPEPSSNPIGPGATPSSVCIPESALELNRCYEGKCLNGGSCDETSGSCSCLKLFSGERCEEHDECWDNADCGNNGQCIDTRSTTYPRLLCYCEQGWYGQNCERRSNVVLQENYTSNPEYSTRVIRPDLYTIHWKFVEDEIEVAIEARSLSWVGLGWRPRSATASCRNAFPTLTERPQADAQYLQFVESQRNQPASQKNPEVDPEQAIEEDLESNIEALCSGSDIEIDENPSTEPEPTSENQPDSEPEPASENQPGSEPEPASENQPGSEPEPASEHQPGYAPEPASEHQPGSEPEPASENQPGSEPEPNAEGTPSAGSEPEPGAGSVEFHPMDCTDIVIGSVKGNLYRVQDMYTRDRSTPRPDSFYLGTDDITGAAGSQVDGITTIVFRKKIQADGASDHTIEDELMSVIWAMGQGIDRYVHSPFSGLEACSASDNGFYRHDELKYHGTSPDQRGVTVFNFYETDVDPEVCTSQANEYKQPRDCISQGDDFNCEYYASWNFNEDSDMIDFVLKSQQDNRNQWIGLGISSNTLMAQTDAITAWIDSDNQPVVVDRWITGYFLPPVDTSNDIQDVSGSYEDGVLTINFRRARNTNDANDLPFSDTECQHLIYASGRLNSAGTDITKHTDTPIVSTNKICIRSCDIETGGAVPALQRLEFSNSVSIGGVIFTENLRNRNSPAYIQLKNQFEDLFSSLYQSFDIENLDSADMKIKIVGFEPDNNVINYRIIVLYDDSNGMTEQEVEDAVSQRFSSFVSRNDGRVEGTPFTIRIIKQSEPFAEWKVAVICAVLMAIIVVTIALISIFIHKCRRKGFSEQLSTVPLKRVGTADSDTSSNSSKITDIENKNSMNKSESQKQLSPV